MKIAFVLLAALCVAGCASRPTDELTHFIKDTKPLAIAGIVRWSDYYKGVYDRLEPMATSPGVGQQMQSMALLIDAAQSYEAGRTTQDQFENVQRMARGIEAENRARQVQAQSQFWGQALQNYGNTVYKQQPQPQSQTITCRTPPPGMVGPTTCD